MSDFLSNVTPETRTVNTVTNDTTGDQVAKQYPCPLATYLEVAQNEGRFMDTLIGLHKSLGTKFMLPVIGGKTLDLHRLFLEVTTRGGLEKVIRDRKWKEIITAFNFPATVTNASFILRKYYLSLLYHYEQVYFFRTQGHISRAASTSDLIEASKGINDGHNTPDIQIQENVPLKEGSLVTGIINGKFDHGYLVSITLNSHKLNGILYHANQGPMLQVSRSKDSHHSRKRSRRAFKDPSRPKSHRSGYNFFFAEQCAKLRSSNYTETNIVSKIGSLWNNLTDSERQVYQEKGQKDVERYKIEMSEYKKSSNAAFDRSFS